MKIGKMHPKYKNGIHAGTELVEFTVAEAVRETIDSADLYRSGELERLQEKLDNTNEFVSQLVQMLADSGALKSGHVAELVGSAFTVQS
jgi:hypothetical protein